MRIAFLVNQVATEIDEYTTTRLARAVTKLGHEAWYLGVGEIDHEPDEKMRALAHPAVYEKGDDLTSFLERIQGEDPQRIELDDLDALWIRNDSIEDLQERPWAGFLDVLFGQMLAARGVTVVNDPAGVSRAVSKLYLHEFPEEIRPKGIVSRHIEEIRDFIARTGRSVVKPLYGAKGRNVFVVEEVEEANLNQIVETVLEDGYAMVQEFVQGGDEGDMRLFLVDGEPLQHDGTYAAFCRIPRGSDPRANISAGAKPVAASIGERELEITNAMKDKLRQDGMFFVGIDIIGDKVVEINGESPGGLQSTEHLTGIDFGEPLCYALERRIRRRD